MGEDYRDELVRQLKECGQDIIDNAESLLTRDIQAVTNFEVVIQLSVDGSMCPTIEAHTEYIPGTHIERITKEGPYGQRF